MVYDTTRLKRVLEYMRKCGMVKDGAGCIVSATIEEVIRDEEGEK